MSYNYLIDIYKLIDQRIEDARVALESHPGRRLEKKFQEGRIKALTDFKNYLIENLNPRLPRRIREDIESKKT